MIDRVHRASRAVAVVASDHRGGRARIAALLVACAAADAIAAGILLIGTPLPRPLEMLAAAIPHGAAVLAIALAARARPERRWLCVASLLAVPLAGLAVATASLFTGGRGTIRLERLTRRPPRRGTTIEAARRLGDTPSPCDALLCGDEEEQRAALANLRRRGDPEAIALLRRSTSGPDPDLALSAALALDEIGERAERGAEQVELVEAGYGAG